MNGPEHYREAERLNERAMHYVYGDGADPVVGAGFAAMAQVHATLANAAALIELRSAYDATQGGITGAQTVQWEEAVGER